MRKTRDRPACHIARSGLRCGLRGWACAIPEDTVNIIGDSSGPNERAMESLPALAVDDLSIREAYRIGRAVHFIGYVLDQENQRIKTGERVHRLLLEVTA